MADFEINLGDIFLVDTRTEKHHWYMAIARLSDEHFLMVNIATWYKGADETCIINPSEKLPSFIKRKSIIEYRYAREYDADSLAAVIVPGSRIPYGQLNPSSLRRYQKESLKSRALKKRQLRAIAQELNIPNYP